MKNVRIVSTVLATSTLFLFGCSDPEQEKREQDLAAGEAIVKQNCKACHAPGINGAPVIGNSKMWSPRIAKGQEALIQSATNGFGLMPAKGGKLELTEEEITLAVKYLISQVPTK